jgi:hypothetical protein
MALSHKVFASKAELCEQSAAKAVDPTAGAVMLRAAAMWRRLADAHRKPTRKSRARAPDPDVDTA